MPVTRGITLRAALPALVAALGFALPATPALARPAVTTVHVANYLSDTVTRASRFVSFTGFIRATASAAYPAYKGAGRRGGVQSGTAFAQMRSYILNLYHGVHVKHSFILDGRYVDCATIKSQPSAQGQRIGKIPRAPQLSGTHQDEGEGADSPLTLGLHDVYGNAISCPNGTVPMPRVSLSETTAFPTMAAYLDLKPATDVLHRYATGTQKVANLGAASTMSVWNPQGYFSLSQEWIYAGSGKDVQTVEAGWINYPTAFKTKDSVPFVYFTPGGYQSDKNRRCYNLNCPKTFVLLDKNFMLGFPFAHYSTAGGKQYSIEFEGLFQDSRWYVYVNGTALGYYPASLFNGGPMSKHADGIEFGGETYTNNSTWPPMGSGQFAAAGPGKAAGQTGIAYFSYPFPTGQGAELTRSAKDPKCYTITGANLSGPAPGNTYIRFGGPGGNC
jgi:hypothetical protein